MCHFRVSLVSSCSFPLFFLDKDLLKLSFANRTLTFTRPLIDHEIIPDPPERSKGKGKGDKGKKGDEGEKGEDRGGLSAKGEDETHEV